MQDIVITQGRVPRGVEAPRKEGVIVVITWAGIGVVVYSGVGVDHAAIQSGNQPLEFVLLAGVRQVPRDDGKIKRTATLIADALRRSDVGFKELWRQLSVGAVNQRETVHSYG